MLQTPNLILHVSPKQAHTYIHAIHDPAWVGTMLKQTKFLESCEVLKIVRFLNGLGAFPIRHGACCYE